MEHASPVLATITIVMPIRDGYATIDRALSSLQGQSYRDWELVAVDDGSTDGTLTRLAHWASVDPRIRIVATDGGLGPSIARNEALSRANGSTVTYLDCDDEYYPDYLEKVDHFRKKGDVVVFGYDVADDENPLKSLQTWDPTPFRDILFAGNLAAPLGVAHSLELALQVGGFDEDLWALEDWDLWRRMARTGAEFIFLPIRSGIYHKRRRSRSRAPRLTEKQRATMKSRLKLGASLYTRAKLPSKPVGKLVLWTPVFPFTAECGAVADVAGALRSLSALEFDCQAFCPSKLQHGGVVSFETALAEIGLQVQVQNTTLAHHTARMIYARAGKVPVSIIETRSTRRAEYSDGEGAAIMDYFERFILANRPDALIACCPGPEPDPVFDLVFLVGKAIDIPTVLWVDGEAAINLTVMQGMDYCVVTSEHVRQRLWDSLGLVCQVLPHVFDWDDTRLHVRDPKVVAILFRNCRGEALVAAKIAEKLRRTRPDIRVLLVDQNGHVSLPVESKSPAQGSHPAECHDRLSPPEVLSGTKLLLVPSLGHGLFDRTLARAMINGIPVVVSNRGALPDTVGGAGFVVEIPSKYQSQLEEVPNADDVSAWLEPVIRLWDDPVLYGDASRRTVEQSLCWHPSRTVPIYAEFFRNLRRQPGPPLLPKCSDKSLEGLWPASSL